MMDKQLSASFRLDGEVLTFCCASLYARHGLFSYPTDKEGKGSSIPD